MRVLSARYTVKFLALATALIVLPATYSQSAPHSAFAVATIKLTDPNQPEKHDVGVMLQTGGLVAKSQTLRELVRFAYGIKSDDQLTGGSGWIDSDRYDVEARVEPTAVSELQSLSTVERTDRLRAMLQTLLAERFHLKTDNTVRELNVFVLTVAKGGPRLTETPPPAAGQAPLREVLKVGSERIVAGDASLKALTTGLSQQPEMRSRMVIDRTGLTGAYTFELSWTPESAAASMDVSAASGATAPSLFTALQEQLGLKLEAAKAPVETLVIESAEKPSAN